MKDKTKEQKKIRRILIITVTFLTHFLTILQVFVNIELYVSTEDGHHQVHLDCAQAIAHL
jgi:hypothetical protein